MPTDGGPVHDCRFQIDQLIIVTNRISMVLVTALGLVIAIQVANSVFTYPGSGYDPDSGFVVWKSMQKGAPFNHQYNADYEDIATDREAFVSHWSPGQYLVPALLQYTGLSPGRALQLTSLLFSLACIVGLSLFGLRALWIDQDDRIAKLSEGGIVQKYGKADHSLLEKLQACPGNTLFFVKQPGLALSLDSRYLLDTAWNKNRLIHGRVGNMFVVLGDGRSVEEQAAILHRFQDYAKDSWALLEGEEIRIYANSDCIN